MPTPDEKKPDSNSDGGRPEASFRLLLEGLYESAVLSGQSVISSDALADKAYEALDPERTEPLEVQALKIRQLRRLAGEICARRRRA